MSTPSPRGPIRVAGSCASFATLARTAGRAPGCWASPSSRYARRFVPGVRRQMPLETVALKALGITKSPRTRYDHLMLGLHDHSKLDRNLPARGVAGTLRFPRRLHLGLLHRSGPARCAGRPVPAGADVPSAGLGDAPAGALPAAHPGAPLRRPAGLANRAARIREIMRSVARRPAAGPPDCSLLDMLYPRPALPIAIS